MAMRERLTLGGCLFVAVAAIGLAAPMAAQAPAARRSTMLRTPDGHPDLEGTYNVATITPVERPAEFGNRMNLTREEAATLERAEADRDQKLDAPTPNADQRTPPPVGGDPRNPNATYLERLFEGGGGVVGGYNNFWLAPGSKVVSVNGENRSSIVIDPPDGHVPRMKPEATRRNAEYLRGAVSPDASESAAAGPPSAYDNPESRPLAERCLLGFGSTSGPPTLPNYFYNNLKQIVQTKDNILILVEMVHDARIIRMNQPHLPPTVRKWMGDSIGHWEGDTLVVETTNFTNKTQFRGSSENLKVTERFTRTDANTLLYRFTVEDPSTWDRPWTGEYNWPATDEHIYEYACHEGNYALEDVLRGARSAEKAGSK
jgi:hypothetical protein